MDHSHAIMCLLGCLLFCTGCLSTSSGRGRFERRMESAEAGVQLAYEIHVPDPGAMPDDGWPLLLFLHGAGERGDDLSRVSVHGPPKLIPHFPELSQCVLVAPQCGAEEWWRSESLGALVEEVRGTLHVDPTRIYVTGISMGGFGTWGLLASYPFLFAAAIPICGGGEPGDLWDGIHTGFDLNGLLKARDVPIRAFHGEADAVVPVAESQRLVKALVEVGADVELTVYPDVGHDSWTQTYLDPRLFTWLFAQRRTHP